MKQKDIMLIVVVVIISALASFFLSSLFFTSPKNRQQPVEVVNPITAEFSQPDTKYFNRNAVDPTKLIQIGDNSNKTPFNSKQ